MKTLMSMLGYERNFAEETLPLLAAGLNLEWRMAKILIRVRIDKIIWKGIEVLSGNKLVRRKTGGGVVLRKKAIGG